MQWAALFACLAFVLAVWLQVMTPEWRYQRPLVRFSLGGLQALLWLPAPVATGMLSSTEWTDGYVWFVLWGMLGFAMQAIGFWLRVSHELAIHHAADKWLLLSDRRYWELQHRSVDGLAGDGMISLTHGLVQIWQVAFAVHVLAFVPGHPLYRVFAVLLLVFATVCVVHSVLYLLSQLTLARKRWSRTVQKWPMFFAGCHLFTLGLTTGWLIVTTRLLR